MLKVSIIVGNPKPKSRTLQVAESFVSNLMVGAEYELEIIDLADHTDEVLVWPSEKMDSLNELVASSDLAVFASPTYKGTYTGLLKSFLDRYPANGLAGLTAIPLLTGADLTHSMGPTVNLSPLLVELGATVPGRGFYFVISQMDRIEEVTSSAAEEYRANFRKVARVAAALPPMCPTSPAEEWKTR